MADSEIKDQWSRWQYGPMEAQRPNYDFALSVSSRSGGMAYPKAAGFHAGWTLCEERYKPLVKEAAEVNRLMQQPIHTVEVFDLRQTGANECPKHGIPPCVQNGNQCSECLRERGQATQRAFALVAALSTLSTEEDKA